MIEKLLSLHEKGKLFTMPDPKPKPNLLACCREVEAELSSVFAQPNTKVSGDDVLHKLIAMYNRTALLQYHFGNYDHAEQLCHKAISLCAECELSESKVWFQAILQPYVNIARIATAKGNWSRALEILDSVRLFTEYGLPLHLGNRVLRPCSEVCLPAECLEIKNFGRTVFIVDGLRALLMADRYPELSTFAETWLQSEFGSNPEFWMMLTEARARALLAMGWRDNALALVREMIARMKSTGRIYPAVYCLVAEVYAGEGKQEEAIKVILRADEAYARPLAQSDKHSAAFNFLCVLALAQMTYGLYEKASVNARAAISLAERLEDEGGKLKAMTFLTYSNSFQESNVGEDVATWHATFCSLLLNSYYRLERTIGCCVAAQCSRVLDKYVEFEHGRRKLSEHALSLCETTQGGIFLTAADLILSINAENKLPELRSVRDKAGEFSHPAISDLYHHFMTLDLPIHVRSRVELA
jgi:tetratricopeptide (TPR) repeat protein